MSQFKVVLPRLSETIILSTRRSVRRKKGDKIGPTRRGKGSKIMAIYDGHGLPLALHLDSASPAEVRLVEDALEDRFLADYPDRLIGDKAYDSDALDKTLMTKWGIEMIVRHRRNRKLGRPPIATTQATLED